MSHFAHTLTLAKLHIHEVLIFYHSISFFFRSILKLLFHLNDSVVRYAYAFVVMVMNLLHYMYIDIVAYLSQLGLNHSGVSLLGVPLE